jgi:hypothetical protein
MDMGVGERGRILWPVNGVHWEGMRNAALLVSRAGLFHARRSKSRGEAGTARSRREHRM